MNGRSKEQDERAKVYVISLVSRLSPSLFLSRLRGRMKSEGDDETTPMTTTTTTTMMMMWGATPPPLPPTPPPLILLILSSNCALPGHSAQQKRKSAAVAVAVSERASDFYFLLSFVLSRPLMATKLRFCQVLLSSPDGR